MKIRNQAGVCLRGNIFQVYDILIICLDINRKCCSKIEKPKQHVSSNIAFPSWWYGKSESTLEPSSDFELGPSELVSLCPNHSIIAPQVLLRTRINDFALFYHIFVNRKIMTLKRIFRHTE